LQIRKANRERVVIEEISPRELRLIYVEFGQFIRHCSPRVALGGRTIAATPLGVPPRLRPLARHNAQFSQKINCGAGELFCSL
jgi:hypothetical protein